MVKLFKKSIPIIQSEKDRRVFIIYFFSFIGIISLLFFGIKGIMDGRLMYCVVIFSFFIVALVNVFFFWIRQRLVFASYMVIFLMFVLELALFAFLGHGTTGLFWYYVFPPLAIMLFANKKGTVISVILGLSTILLLSFPKEIMVNDYSNEIIIRFIFTYAVVVALINIYEYSRIKAHNAYLKALHETNVKNDEITKQKEELRSKSEQLSISNKELELKNMQIIDSIEYAKLIQEAILPSKSTFDENFSESFIIYKPKNIVSGDFYWLRTKDRYIYLAVIDCTGHGVSGAFMSMIGNTLLNEIISDTVCRTPCELLNELNKKIFFALKQGGENLDSDGDGMDLSMLRIDRTSGIMLFAGANQKILIIDQNKIKILHSDPFSLGGLFHKRICCKYENQQIDISKTAYLYLFTDGFSDQYGGEHDEKLQSERFYSLLQQASHMDIQSQKSHIEKYFDSWKGENVQIDDVTVLGIKI